MNTHITLGVLTDNVLLICSAHALPTPVQAMNYSWIHISSPPVVVVTDRQEYYYIDGNHPQHFQHLILTKKIISNKSRNFCWLLGNKQNNPLLKININTSWVWYHLQQQIKKQQQNNVYNRAKKKSFSLGIWPRLLVPSLSLLVIVHTLWVQSWYGGPTPTTLSLTSGKPYQTFWLSLITCTTKHSHREETAHQDLLHTQVLNYSSSG